MNDKEYGNVLNVCNKWNESNKRLSRLALDVLLLADVFERLRNNKLKNHGLCPSHYMSATGISWDAVLIMIVVELELIPDPDIYIFYEKVTRGRISCIYNRYNKAKNKHLKRYNSKQEWKHIIYLDANNLYSYAMSKFLPTGGFKWIHPKELDLNENTTSC